MKPIFLCLVTLLTCSQLNSNEINWSSPPNSISTAGQNASDPQIATDPSGNIVSAWIENGAVKTKSKHLNASWGATETLSSANSSSPRLVCDQNGNATLIWLEGTIIKASTKPFGNSWSPIVSLSNSGASSPSIAIDTAGNIVAAWAKNSAIETSTKIFGGNWSSRNSISSPNSAFSPSVAVGGTTSSARAIIVWHAANAGVNTVFASTKLLSGGGWSSRTAISDPSHQAAYAHVAIDLKGNAIALWHSYDTTGSCNYNVTVQASERVSNGDWDAPISLSMPGIKDPSTLLSRIAFDANGNAIALWTTSFDNATFNIQSAVKPIRQSWTEATTLVNVNPFSYQADLAVTSIGDSLALYMFYNGSALQIQSADSDITGFVDNLWSIPINVFSTNNNGFPRIAATLTGNVINAAAVWMSNNGTNTAVLASTGNRSIVLPPSNLAVTQQTNNFGIFTEYTNTVSWTESEDPDVVGYLIYRDGEYLGQVNATRLYYIDHNRVLNGSVIYGIATINSQNSHSKIINISFP